MTSMKYPCIIYALTAMKLRSNSLPQLKKNNIGKNNHMGITCVSQNVPLHLNILNR